MKAAGTGWRRGVRWVDIETVPVEDGGRVSDVLDLRLHGVVAGLCQALCQERSPDMRLASHLAVGRGRTHAVATVLLEARHP